MYSTVPTHDQILVPETLLKKRKSQEKARAERTAEVEKKKKVSDGSPKQTTSEVMILRIHATTRLRSMMSANILSFGSDRWRTIWDFNGFDRNMDADFIFHQANKEKRGVIFKRAEKYVQEYRDAEREKVRLGRVAKQTGEFYVPAESQLIFIIRIKGYVLPLHS